MIPSRPPTIRVLFGTLLAPVMLLAAGLFAVTSLQRDTATKRTAAEHQRVTSFLLVRPDAPELERPDADGPPVRGSDHKFAWDNAKR